MADAKDVPVNWNKQKDGNFKRPDHDDFRTHSELKKVEFSGVRHNSVTQEWEIWILGEIRALGPKADVNAFAAAYEEVFGLEHVEIVSFEVPPGSSKQ
jgi:hypothetical protein